MDLAGTPRFRYALLLREIDDMWTAEDFRSVGLVLIRLAGLEAVNANFGYIGGDRALEEFEQRLLAVARQRDRVFRVGSTSFALLIHNPTNEGHAVLGAERISREAREPVLLGARRARLQAHMGVSLLPELAGGTEELLRHCELALDESRDRDEPYIVYSDGLAAGSAGHARADFDIHEALDKAELEMYFQPKVHLGSRELAGAEALIRWNSPRDGVQLPEAFLPGVERGWAIHALFGFSLNAALRQACDWCQKVPEFVMAVNMSPGNLEDPYLIDTVTDALGVWNLDADRLVLEITETALMRDPRASAAKLQALHELGVRIAIDDFGTGHASLAYLRDLPADELKIDRSFITQMLTSDRDRRIVASIIQLAHAVNMQVVAEGIEDGDAAQVLQDMGCEIGQGYFFNRPLSAGNFATAWLREREAAEAGADA
ncbi:MAG: EAL domain-containing protein [Chromatiales bacterium]|nr:MAG: EAL domain-containing protein [Chromatiales bacterium]